MKRILNGCRRDVVGVTSGCRGGMMLPNTPDL